ncbi:MAG: hypothetical protein Pars2KO_01390 [Parasphingorhabdus sp.]
MTVNTDIVLQLCAILERLDTEHEYLAAVHVAQAIEILKRPAEGKLSSIDVDSHDKR